jgi:hypothetical protein
MIVDTLKWMCDKTGRSRKLSLQVKMRKSKTIPALALAACATVVWAAGHSPRGDLKFLPIQP